MATVGVKELTLNRMFSPILNRLGAQTYSLRNEAIHVSLAVERDCLDGHFNQRTSTSLYISANNDSDTRRLYLHICPSLSGAYFYQIYTRCMDTKSTHIQWSGHREPNFFFHTDTLHYVGL